MKIIPREVKNHILLYQQNEKIPKTYAKRSSIKAGVTLNINFPSGHFTKAPSVVVTSESGDNVMYVKMNSITKESVTIVNSATYDVYYNVIAVEY